MLPSRAETAWSRATRAADRNFSAAKGLTDAASTLLRTHRVNSLKSGGGDLDAMRHPRYGGGLGRMTGRLGRELRVRLLNQLDDVFDLVPGET